MWMTKSHAIYEAILSNGMVFDMIHAAESKEQLGSVNKMLNVYHAEFKY